MKTTDILGREVNDYDIVVAKGTGRNVIGMNVGLWLGKSVLTEHSRRSVSDIFLVQNPTSAELAIKDRILQSLLKEEAAKKKKAAIKTIPLSKMEVGGIYEDLNGRKEIFLGRCEQVTYKKDYSRYTEIDCISGICFLPIYSELGDVTVQRDVAEMLDRKTGFSSFRREPSRWLGFLKGNRKFKKKTGQISLDREYSFESTYNNRWTRNEQYKVTLELLDLPEETPHES